MKTTMLAAALVLAACGGMEGVEDETGVGEAGLSGSISGVPYWTAVWATDLAANPLRFPGTSCTFTFDELGPPMMVGGFVMDLDRHFHGPVEVRRRACTLEAKKDVVLPLLTVSYDASDLEVRPPEKLMRARVTAFVDAARDLEVLIDGENARSLGIDFVRTGAETYSYLLPSSGALYTPASGELEVPGAMTDGIWMVLPGLMQGHHQLAISGKLGGRAFRAEYRIEAL
jgi:hypothetical protein